MYQTLASLARTRVVFADKKKTGNSIRPLQVLLLLPPPICEVNLPLALSDGEEELEEEKYREEKAEKGG